MDEGHVVLNGVRYRLAHDELVPRGKRAWARTLRPSDIADPSQIKTARWNIDGPMGFSREGGDGYLGTDYADNLDHRYDKLLTSTAARKTVTLADSVEPFKTSADATVTPVAAEWTETGNGDGFAHDELGSYDAPNDATHWGTSTNSSPYLILELPARTDPGVDTGHIIRARCIAPLGNTETVGVKLRLYDSGTTNVIATSEEFSVEPFTEVELLDTWTTGENVVPTHSISAGPNRLLLAMVSCDHNANATNDLTALTYGEQAMTHYASAIDPGGTSEQRVEVWYLDEAGIGEILGTTLAPTWEQTTAPTHGVAYSLATFKNVNQTTPISDDSSAVDATDLTLTPLAVSNGDYVAAAAVNGYSNPGSWTITSGYTERFAGHFGNSNHSVQDKAVTADGTESLTAKFSIESNRAAGIAVVLQGAVALADAGTNVEFAIPEVNVATFTDYTALRIGISASSVPSGALRVSAMQFELPQASVQNIISIDEDRGQLFVHRGQKTAQVNPGDMTEVGAAVDHTATITDSVPSWRGSGFVAFGDGKLVQKRTDVAADTPATYGNVAGIKAHQMAVGPDRMWITVAGGGSDAYKLQYVLDDVVDSSNFSNAFQVSDPGTASNGIFTIGEYMVLGHERGANSFTSSGKPKRLLEAVSDFPSSANGAAGTSLWGWVYVATELGLFAINVESSVANPVGPGEGIRGQGFEGPIDGYPTAVATFKDSLWVSYYTTSGDSYSFRGMFGPETAATGRPEWFSFRRHTSAVTGAIGATAGRTNPTLLVAEAGLLTYYTLGRRGRDIADSNYEFSADDGVWYGTTMMRTGGMLTNIRAARFFTENCNSLNSWQLAISVDGGDFVDVGGAVTTNGLQTVRPTSNGAPLGTVHGSYFKPRLTQVAVGSTNPPQIRGFLDVTYDERPEAVEEHTFMIVLGDGDLASSTEDGALSGLLERGGAAAQLPIPITLPGETETTFGFVVGISGRMDLDAHGTQAVAVTVLGWDVA